MRELSKFSTKNGMADPIAAFKHAFDNQGDAYTGFAQGLGTIVQAHVSSAQQALGHHLEHNQKGLGKLSSAFMSPVLYPQWLEYLSDAGQRAVLFTDAMRQCGNYFVEHENNANKTVLSWDHEVVVDGSKLDRPVNYSLVRIIASEDIRVREDGRPYIIIDPRAGHGSGIGGFNTKARSVPPFTRVIRSIRHLHQITSTKSDRGRCHCRGGRVRARGAAPSSGFTQADHHRQLSGWLGCHAAGSNQSRYHRSDRC